MEGWRAKAIFVISQKSIYLKQLHFTFCHSLIKRNITIRLGFLLFSSPSSILQIIYGVMGKQVTSQNTKERKHKRAEGKKRNGSALVFLQRKILGTSVCQRVATSFVYLPMLVKDFWHSFFVTPLHLNSIKSKYFCIPLALDETPAKEIRKT